MEGLRETQACDTMSMARKTNGAKERERESVMYRAWEVINDLKLI